MEQWMKVEWEALKLDGEPEVLMWIKKKKKNVWLFVKSVRKKYREEEIPRKFRGGGGIKKDWGKDGIWMI